MTVRVLDVHEDHFFTLLIIFHPFKLRLNKANQEREKFLKQSPF